MKWISVNKEKQKNNAYELWYNDKKILSLSFSNITKIARIETDSDKRVFFVEKKGFLQNKTVIRNEYGIKLGQLSSEKNAADEGSIEMDGNKYGYSLNGDNEAAITVFGNDTTVSRPFLYCNLPAVIDNATALVKRSISFHDTKVPFLLMALCWYLKTNRF